METFLECEVMEFGDIGFSDTECDFALILLDAGRAEGRAVRGFPETVEGLIGL